MKTAFQTKTLETKTLDISTETKQVKIAIAEMESVDYDGDLFAKTAFDKTIKESGPKGSNEIWHLVDHTPSLKSALGKFSELYVDGKYLVGVSKFKDSPLWNQIWPLYESGDINQHSVGFSTINETKAEGHNLITEVRLFEGSAVPWGANKNTPTLEVVKGMERAEQLDYIQKKFQRLCKALSKGDSVDELSDTSLLIIELKQLQQLFTDITTQPVIETVEPDNSLTVEAIKQWREQFKSEF